MRPYSIIPSHTNKICYLILPQGVSRDLDEALNVLAKAYDVTLVLLEQVDWNDDLTPWPAPGVFKKAKPFGGRAHEYLRRLCAETIPPVEASLQVTDAHRTLLGVSLSGLFAVWTAFNTDIFSHIISISGSLWYDGFTEWAQTQRLSPQVKRICLLLGDREKNSKERRMATVEHNTRIVADILTEKGDGAVRFELVEGTHFSPIMPRIEKAFSFVFS